ncbi:hypothetical protein [Hungatella hathewayi]|uniref:hypothetical protein n=1 Tax=Hungatella hathewayi TaxID=154046 RepID=UPI002A81D8CA|nr:hypothetical protein [Hungatella hathewayi]
MKIVKVPLTEEMKADYKECADMMEDGVEKDCEGCSCNGGSLECLGEYQWCSDWPEN